MGGLSPVGVVAGQAVNDPAPRSSAFCQVLVDLVDGLPGYSDAGVASRAESLDLRDANRALVPVIAILR